MFEIVQSWIKKYILDYTIQNITYKKLYFLLYNLKYKGCILGCVT